MDYYVNLDSDLRRGATPHFATRKPKTCPNCGSPRIADILYGRPVVSDEMRQKFASGSVVQGGCCSSSCDPSWHCTECRASIYRTRVRQEVEEFFAARTTASRDEQGDSRSGFGR